MNSVSSSMFWKLLERFGFHAIKLSVQIVLARLLLVEDFGILGIVMVFVDLATIFVQGGLNTALIQNKSSGRTEYSTVFFASLFVSVVIYLILFFLSPFIAQTYNNPSIKSYLRVVGLCLFGGSFNSIQIAYASARYEFKSQFKCNFLATSLSGAIGILMAIYGYGIWSLIFQQLLFQYLSCVLMFFSIKWRPSFDFDFKKLKSLLSFGWKVFASNLLMRMKSLISNLIIGKHYSAEELAYYSKAQNFPTAFSDVVVNSVSSVALVRFSHSQDDRNDSVNGLSSFVSKTMFFVAPIMMCLAVVADSFVTILLSEKWLPCVPYLRLFCFFYIFQPICAVFGQVISANGRSDLYLRVYIIVEPIGLISVIICAWLRVNPIGIAVVLLLTQILETFILSCEVKRVLDIGLLKQFIPWFRSVFPSAMMFVVYPLSLFVSNVWCCFFVQVALSLVVYFIFSLIVNRNMVSQMISLLKRLCKSGAERKGV